MTDGEVKGQPCWYVDREPWEEVHYATEQEARGDADRQAREDDNSPDPVRRHDVPCQVFVCRDCGGTYHVLGDAEIPADNLCAHC